MAISLRQSGLGRYSGVDEQGVRFTVGAAGPGLWTGLDERGDRVAIRMTGISQATFHRAPRDEPAKRPAPEKRNQPKKRAR
jgi:hypothetical protein